MDISGMIPTGDSISNKFSLKVLDSTPYSYIMEVKLLDINLPKFIEKKEGDQEVLDVINFMNSQTIFDDVEKIGRNGKLSTQMNYIDK